ncbi:MAG: hypothetical protein ACMG6H_01265 [Acidobacteriota bacterium]
MEKPIILTSQVEQYHLLWEQSAGKFVDKNDPRTKKKYRIAFYFLVPQKKTKGFRTAATMHDAKTEQVRGRFDRGLESGRK